MSGSWKKIGECGVDSGQLMIVDPCYIKENEWSEELPKDFGSDWSLSPSERKLDYAGVCAASLPTNGGDFTLDNGLAVCFPSGYGDGGYPVYAYINEDNRVMQVFVDMDGVEEDEMLKRLNHYMAPSRQNIW